MLLPVRVMLQLPAVPVMPFWSTKLNTSSPAAQLVVICAVAPIKVALSLSVTVSAGSIAVAGSLSV